MESKDNLDKYKKIVSHLNSDSNLHFIYYETDFVNVIGSIDTLNKLEIAFKKGLLYANKTVIVTREISADHHYGDGVDNCNDDYDNLFAQSEVSKSLRNLNAKYMHLSPFVKNVHFLPERLIYEADYTDSFYHTERSKDILFDFSSAYRNNFGIKISFKDPNISHHIFEAYKNESDETGILNVWLPQLKNVPFDTLLRVKEDENDTFQNFQFALRKLLSEFTGLDSESKLKEIFQFVDHHVRELELRLNNIQKMTSIAKYDAIISSTIMGLTYFLPPEIAKFVLAVVGAYQIKELKSKLFLRKEKMNDMKLSDFYAPWLVGKKARR